MSVGEQVLIVFFFGIVVGILISDYNREIYFHLIDKKDYVCTAEQLIEDEVYCYRYERIE
jgi:hypothetical protein